MDLRSRIMPDISASFQKAVKLHLLQKTKKIFKYETKIRDFAIVGGASANLYIPRCILRSLCREFNKRLHTAELC